MRILADENCDRMIVNLLREAGHDVVSILESGGGDEDEDIFRQAHSQQRVLLTDDLDFGLLAELEIAAPPAVILMRLAPLSRAARAKRAVDAIASLDSSGPDGFVVLEPAQMRLRPWKHPDGTG